MNINERFSHNVLSILDAFLTFNMDGILTDRTSTKFSVYGHSDIKALSNHYFVDQNETKDSSFLKNMKVSNSIYCQ